jgi:hypothetical protein
MDACGGVGLRWLAAGGAFSIVILWYQWSFLLQSAGAFGNVAVDVSRFLTDLSLLFNQVQRGSVLLNSRLFLFCSWLPIQLAGRRSVHAISLIKS